MYRYYSLKMTGHSAPLLTWERPEHRVQSSLFKATNSCGVIHICPEKITLLVLVLLEGGDDTGTAQSCVGPPGINTSHCLPAKSTTHQALQSFQHSTCSPYSASQSRPFPSTTTTSSARQVPSGVMILRVTQPFQTTPHWRSGATSTSRPTT